MTYSYRPKGVCSQKIDLTIEDGVIQNIRFTGGCSGNTQGVAALCIGRKPEEVIPLIRGIRCGFKPTSCPDQLSLALEAAMAEAK
ncbi:MAG TPA: TIGR03905 family TSCPD domain-containing protein [Candidatus Merdivicinus faecavium]|nr:TIGR03905 family TSCPD domain-containing protein [Candidatus Merdivicinus faecavium]